MHCHRFRQKTGPPEGGSCPPPPTQSRDPPGTGGGKGNRRDGKGNGDGREDGALGSWGPPGAPGLPPFYWPRPRSRSPSPRGPWGPPGDPRGARRDPGAPGSPQEPRAPSSLASPLPFPSLLFPFPSSSPRRAPGLGGGRGTGPPLGGACLLSKSVTMQRRSIPVRKYINILQVTASF